MQFVYLADSSDAVINNDFASFFRGKIETPDQIALEN
jgi:hypothetical protein